MSQLVCRPNGGAVDHVAAKPKITVLVAVQNDEAHLRECLQGLMEQTIADSMEVIVIDRASRQSEWAIAADLQGRYPNLTAVRTPAISCCAAWNLGGKIASGKYLTVLEATDRLRKDALERLCAALDENPGAMAAYGDTCFTSLPHETFEKHTSFGKMIWPDYTVQQLGRISLVAPHLLWRREVHDTIGWFEHDDDAPLRTLLLQTVRHYRVLHVNDFLGLKLVLTDGALNRAETSAAADVPLRCAAVQPPAPAPSLVIRAAEEPVALDAEGAYLAVQQALQAGDEEAALEGLRRLVQAHPDHATAHNDLAALSYRNGDVAAALRHYEAAVRCAPEDSVFRKNLADLYFVESGRTDEAIAIYLQLLKESPRDVETLLNLGIISETIGHPEQAESFYQRGLEIEPWNPTLRERVTALRAGTADEPAREGTAEERYAAAQEMVAKGAPEEALLALDELVGSFPDFALAHNDLAVLSYQTGDMDKALSHYEKAARLDPENSVFQKNLADFYFVEGNNPDGAIAIYLDELRKEPRNVETLMSLGKICEMLHRGEEARTFYDQVLQLEPWNREARESLRMVA